MLLRNSASHPHRIRTTDVGIGSSSSPPKQRTQNSLFGRLGSFAASYRLQSGRVEFDDLELFGDVVK
jgi:hypothetical protein